MRFRKDSHRDSSPPRSGDCPDGYDVQLDDGTVVGHLGQFDEALIDGMNIALGLARGPASLEFLLCHSEGNYMLILAIHQLVSTSTFGGPFLGQVLSAADINNGALQAPSSSSPWAGQGSPIARLDGQAYTMLLAAEAQAGLFRPRGMRLKRHVPPGAEPIPELEIGSHAEA